MPEQSQLPYSPSQIFGSPSFRNAAVNFVAVVPLLSSRNSEKSGGTSSSSHSVKSFDNLLEALQRYGSASASAGAAGGPSQQQQQPQPGGGGSQDPPPSPSSDLLLVIPNSSLTRPGDWRYGDTPLRGFHWQHGCQRLAFGDGRPASGGSGRRPSSARSAQDRILNTSARDWVDLCPSRRTAAVIGVLNLRDCEGPDDLRRAEEELRSWASRYSSPPYEVTALGRSFDRDRPLERMFVFESFDEKCQSAVDLSASTMQDSMLAFPPVGDEHQQMMDLHLNVVVNDLAVAVFRSLEDRIRESDAICRLNLHALQAAQQEASHAASMSSSTAASVRSSLTRIISGNAGGGSTAPTSSSSSAAGADEPVSAASRALSLNSLVSLVSPDSKLAKDTYAKSRSSASSPSVSFADPSGAPSAPGSAAAASPLSSASASAAALNANITDVQRANSSPKLITPLDAYWERGGLSSKDVDAIRRRDLARREKWAGDASLLAGSPLDAYERYLKAAEMCRSPSTPDPLWYASALEGCAAAHIAMAEAGGYGVDEYLEANFSMPEEVVSLVTATATAARREGDAGLPPSGGGGASGKRGAAGGPAKQTLPEVVCALCEEALNITNRHEKLAAYHAELLLKLAGYVAEASESHLRCRWGEGEGCYPGEVDDTPRWQKPSVSKLNFSDRLPSHSAAGLDSMTAVNSYHRTKQVCELLHEAVSIAALDPATRVDVAAGCVRLCLSGVKMTQWRGPGAERIPLPRKAAFFAVVAAEAMSGVKTESAQQTARDLWLFATQLYLERPVRTTKGGAYGWAGLRAITLNALSLQGNNPLSLMAAGELLSLLSEIDPPLEGATDDHPAEERVDSAHRAPSVQTSVHGTGSSHGRAPSSHGKTAESSGHGGKLAQSLTSNSGKPPLDSSVQSDVSGGETVNRKAGSFARQLRESFASLTSGSLILAMESRWADDEVFALLNVPLASSAVQPLGCVWRTVPKARCIEAQAQCLGLLAKLHRSLPTESMIGASLTFALPIYVSSPGLVQAESDLEVERVRKEVKKDAGASSDPMATFFNPFENKRSSKRQEAVVAEGEERTLCVELSNRLSVPVNVLRCQLLFKGVVEGAIKTTPLSFTIPPKAVGFAVHFPFVILPSGDNAQRDFEIEGIQLTFAGRVISLPIGPGSSLARQGSANGRRTPQPASLNRKVLSPRVSSEITDQDLSPRIVSCPPQPCLQVYLAKTLAPVNADRPIHVNLVDGELYNLPTLVIKTYLGPSGRGFLERLQIFSVDLPGLADKKIYDSDVESPLEPDFIPRIDKDQPPMKLRCLSPHILSDLNESGSSGSRVTIQAASSYKIRKQLPKGAAFKLRFRFRGVPGTSNEYWRRRDVSFRVTCVKGPRISSMDFQPLLLPAAAYGDTCRALRTSNRERRSFQDRAIEADARDVESSKNPHVDLHHIGLEGGIHVSSKNASFVLTVVNETSADLMLSKEDGSAVGGCQDFPMPTVLVHSGVSAKIPVVIPRIARTFSGSSADELVDKIIELTKLRWEVRSDTCTADDVARPGASVDELAQGCLSVPRSCLMDIIERHPSFVAGVCDAPCDIELFVQGSSVAEVASVLIQTGRPLNLAIKVKMASWIPRNALDNCHTTFEFLCGRMAANGGAVQTAKRDFVWGGKPRQSFDLKGFGEKDALSARYLEYNGMIAFCADGEYALSACARFSYAGSSQEEVWLSPTAAVITVERVNFPSMSAD